MDAVGNAYVTGTTGSADFPTQGPLQPALGGSTDVFVTKLSADGSTLLYSTYIGGSAGDNGLGVAVGAAGEAFVTGFTLSTNFPTANPLQASTGGGPGDAFVLKLDPAGSTLIYSTYLGGNGFDKANAIALDSSGNAYLTGESRGTFPIVGGFQPSSGLGFTDAFVAKLNPTGSALVYSSYLGGGNIDEGRGIAVDSAGNAYVTGNTVSTNFPTVNPIQPATSPGGKSFVVKVNPAGSALVFSTAYGGAPGTVGTGIALDSADDIYISGYSVFDGLGTAGSAQPVFGGFRDAFAAKFTSDGSAVVYSTYIGGAGFEEGWGISVDSSGSAYVVGLTESADLFLADPVQSVYGGSRDAFVAKISKNGSSFVYSTFLGGDQIDAASAVAVGTEGDAYLVGKTGSGDFPTVDALQANNAGGSDAFVAKLFEPEPIVTPIPGASTWGLVALAMVAFVLLVLRPRRAFRPERWRRF